MHPLVPEADLREKDGPIQDALRSVTRPEGMWARDDAQARAFRYYLLFTDRAAMIQAGLAGLTDEQQLYNRYYWFLRFAELTKARIGCNAGLDQQAFKLLDGAGCQVDWAIIESVTKRVQQEVKDIVIEGGSE